MNPDLDDLIDATVMAALLVCIVIFTVGHCAPAPAHAADAANPALPCAFRRETAEGRDACRAEQERRAAAAELAERRAAAYAEAAEDARRRAIEAGVGTWAASAPVAPWADWGRPLGPGKPGDPELTEMRRQNRRGM